MRVKKGKFVRKYLKFFKIVFNIDAPYQVRQSLVYDILSRLNFILIYFLFSVLPLCQLY